MARGPSSGGRPTARLYTKGVVMGYQRSVRLQHPNFTLVKIEGVQTRTDATKYLGKRVAYIYKAKLAKPRTAKRNFHGPLGGFTKYRVIWGRIARQHGNAGTVRVRFRSNLPGSSFGQPVRVMLYPSRI